MGDKTAIEWCDATWNPVTGCSHVSAGCEACYAEALSLRFGFSKKPWTARNAAENVVLHPDRLDQPLRWRKPRRIFVNSMSDLFHEQIPEHFIMSVWSSMEACRDRHTFQILTKRPERMRDFVAAHKRWFDYAAGAGVYEERHRHVWLGVSIEQDRWVGRADVLRDTPAAVRFISAEPLLEPLPSLNLDGIGWVITGGESGPHHRPFDPAWAAAIRDQCQQMGVPFLHKQHGGITPKSGGRLLDGRTWDEYPKGASA